MELDVEKGLIPAHDIVGACSNCGLQEFVIIRIAANGLGKRDRLNDLRAELDNFENGVETAALWQTRRGHDGILPRWAAISQGESAAPATL